MRFQQFLCFFRALSSTFLRSSLTLARFIICRAFFISSRALSSTVVRSSSVLVGLYYFSRALVGSCALSSTLACSSSILVSSHQLLRAPRLYSPGCHQHLCALIYSPALTLTLYALLNYCALSLTLVRSLSTFARSHQLSCALISSLALLSTHPLFIKHLMATSTLMRSRQLSYIIISNLVHQIQFSCALVRFLKHSSTIKSSHQPCAIFNSQAHTLLSILVRSHQLSCSSSTLVLSHLVRFHQHSNGLVNSSTLSSTISRYHRFSFAIVTSRMFVTTLALHQSRIVSQHLSGLVNSRALFINCCVLSSNLVSFSQHLYTVVKSQLSSAILQSNFRVLP